MIIFHHSIDYLHILRKQKNKTAFHIKASGPFRGL